MRVVLISLDAAFHKDIEKLQKTKHIGRLMAQGAYTAAMRTVYPALTYPAHVSMMTGKHPIDHGVGHNQPFDLSKPAGSMPDENRPWYWDIRDIACDTMFDRLHQKGKTCAAILWPVTGKSRAIKYLFPEVLALPGESQVLKMLRYGNPFYILGTELKYGKQRKGVKEPYLSDYAALLAVKLLEKRRPPDLIAVHLVDLDAARHHTGVFSKEADAALDRLDQRVGAVLAVMDRRNLWRDTCVMLVSDHGQKDITHFTALEPALEKAGIPAHVQSLGTGAALYFKAPGFEKRAQAFLQDNREALHIKAVYDRQALDRFHAAKPYTLCVEGQDGTAFTDCLEGAKREKATHGFPPDDGAALCLMILSPAKGYEQAVHGASDVTHVAGLVEQIVLGSGGNVPNTSKNDE